MRYSHLGPSALRESINTLEPKSSLNLNFGHHMDTKHEKIDLKREVREA